MKFNFLILVTTAIQNGPCCTFYLSTASKVFTVMKFPISHLNGHKNIYMLSRKNIISLNLKRLKNFFDSQKLFLKTGQKMDSDWFTRIYRSILAEPSCRKACKIARNYCSQCILGCFSHLAASGCVITSNCAQIFHHGDENISPV